MSSSPIKFSRDEVERAYTRLLTVWAVPEDKACAVGSFRRGREELGDLDILMPMPAAPSGGKWGWSDDPVFVAINATMSNALASAPDALFAPAPPTVADPVIVGRSEKGLKPGFKEASLVLNPWSGRELKVQIFRATAAGFGWAMVHRTGPENFGPWFLGQWKKRHGIPLNDDHRKASIDGCLVDHAERIVPVWTEEACFMACGLPFIPPADRDGYVENLRKRAREAMQ